MLEAISAITSLNNITLTLKTRAGFLILVSAENKVFNKVSQKNTFIRKYGIDRIEWYFLEKILQ